MTARLYAEALAKVGHLDATAGAEIAAECRSLVLTHGRQTRRATVFFHGLTASPRQFAALAAEVYRSGENVLIPRLPRHGHADRLTDALRSLRVSELLTTVTDALEIAAGLGASVRVVGFSLGGTLAIWTAQHHDVEAAIAIAPVVGLAGVPPRLTAALARLLHRLPNAFLWWDPIRRDRLMPAHGYARYPTRAIAQILVLAGEVRRAARTAAPRSPITLVTNAGETAVNNAAIAALATSWRRHRGADVREQRLAGMPLSHDIVEPLRERSLTLRSYPLLRVLLGLPPARNP